MGCGSSTAQQSDVKEAVAPNKGKGSSGKHGSDHAAAEKPATDNAPHSNHKHEKHEHGHHGHDDKKESPEVTKKKMVSRASSDASKQRVHHGAAAPTCELDPKHTAVIWCSSCEHNLCLSCDESAHANARAAVHHRNWIETGEQRVAGQQEPPRQAGGADAGKKSKFVLKENEAHSHESAPSQQKQKFNVEKFPSPTDSTSGPHKHSHKHGEEASSADAPPPTALSTAISRLPENAHVLNALSEDQLLHLSQAELDALFNRYDKDHSGVLKRDEIKLLADDVIIRVIALIREDLHRKNPDLSASDIEKKVAEEKVFALPGKSFQETEVEMKRRLHYALDLNRDGKITKQEFMAQWGTFSRDQFKLHTEGELACSIM